MQQVQINILQPRLLQTLVNAGFRAFVADVAGSDFGGVEELIAGDAGREHALGGGGFIAVDGRGVDVTVAGGDGVVGYVAGDGGGGLVDAWCVVLMVVFRFQCWEKKWWF